MCVCVCVCVCVYVCVYIGSLNHVKQHLVDVDTECSHCVTMIPPWRKRTYYKDESVIGMVHLRTPLYYMRNS